jgi:hypothetical protein
LEEVGGIVVGVEFPPFVGEAEPVNVGSVVAVRVANPSVGVVAGFDLPPV